MAKNAIVTNEVTNTIVVTTKVTKVQVYSNNDSIRYRLTLEDKIDAIVRNKDTDEYEEGSVDYLDFYPSVLIAQCLDIVEGLDLMYTKKKEQGLRSDSGNGFGAAELQVILRKAKFTFERTKFEAGDEYTTRDGDVEVHEYAGYNTNITDIVVSDRIQDKLDSLIDKMFDL